MSDICGFFSNTGATLPETGNPVQRMYDFGQKFITQSGRFVVVELDCFVQFDFRNLEKSNFHLFVFGQDFFEGNGL